MRVIAGTYRSRVLKAPRGLLTRPTGDRLRERLFNILAPHVHGARMADLYAGSGAIGIEALSRGAASVVFVEKAPDALDILRANLSALEIRGGAKVMATSVTTALKEAETPFDLVYLDPPYAMASEYEQTLRMLGQEAERLLAPDAIVVAEHAAPRGTKADGLPVEQYGILERYRMVRQGDAALSFYRVSADQMDAAE